MFKNRYILKKFVYKKNKNNMGLLTGAAISGAASIATNALNSYAVKKQNEINMQNWREQNEYNTPKNQRKRFEEAGLAPQLMYGGSTQTAGFASAPPKQEAPRVDLSQIGSVVETYLNLKAKDTAIENTRMQTAKTEADKERTYSEIDNIIPHQSRKLRYEAQSAQMKATQDQWMTSEKEGKTPFREKFAKEMESMDSRNKNLDQSTMTLEQQLKIAKIMEYVPKAQKEQYEQYGILPQDDGNTQVMKVLFKMISGTKINSSNSKMPSGLLRFLIKR